MFMTLNTFSGALPPPTQFPMAEGITPPLCTQRSKLMVKKKYNPQHTDLRTTAIRNFPTGRTVFRNL